MIDLDRPDAIRAAETYLDHPQPLFARLPFDYRWIPSKVRVAGLALSRRVGGEARPFPAWPIEASLDPPGEPLTKQHRAALLLTHDLDSTAELDSIEPLRRFERAFGVPSAWGFVPGVSWPSEAQARELLDQGCEPYWHDIAHDGRLPYLGVDAIRRAFHEVEHASPWATEVMRSFRSGQLLMTRDLLTVVGERFDIDLSIPDTERGGPHGATAGCGTVRPFRVGGLLEMPLSLPQDFYLRNVEGLDAAATLAVWQSKIDHIARVGGVAVLNTHPVWTGPGRRDMLEAYLGLIDWSVRRGDLLITTPTRLAHQMGWGDELTVRSAPSQAPALILS